MIGVTGLAGSGKDTFADFLLDALNDMNKKAIKRSFAGPIKKIAMDIFGFSEEQVYDPVTKEVLDEFWNITPRRFMQLVGTEMFRHTFRDVVWVHLMERERVKNKHRIILVPDVRFDNEAEYIRQHGVVLRVVREEAGLEGELAQHLSEKGISDHLIDDIIYNDGTLDDLGHKAIEKAIELSKRIRIP